MPTDPVPRRVALDYFSDALCIWAFVHQARLDALRREFGEQIVVRERLIPLFAATDKRIREGWAEQGGFAGYNRNVREIASHFEHVTVHPEVWLRNIPASSTPTHLFVKAVQLLQERGEIPAERVFGEGIRSPAEEALWRVRREFFEMAANVCDRNVLNRIAIGLDLPVDRIHGFIASGEAHAALHADLEAKEAHRVTGSPTLVLNDGRQVLYGNVGYRIIEANVRELLHERLAGEASWC